MTCWMPSKWARTAATTPKTKKTKARRIAIFLAFVFFVLGVVAAVLAHFEGIQQVMDDVAELSLVLDQVFQPVEILPRTFFNQRAPQIDEPLGGRRRGQPGQTLAHHEGERVFDRRIRTFRDLVELAAMEALIEHRREILRDAVHAPGADRFDARLLYRFEDRPGLLAGRLKAAMQGLIVTREAQRNRVGVAANDCRLALAEFAWRFGQPDLSAHQARSLSRERDLKFRLARQGAQATGHRALERFGRRLFRRRLG